MRKIKLINNKTINTIDGLGDYCFITNPQDVYDNFENVAESLRMMKDLQKATNILDGIDIIEKFWDSVAFKFSINGIYYYDKLKDILSVMSWGMEQMVKPEFKDMAGMVHYVLEYRSGFAFIDDENEVWDRTSPCVDFEHFQIYNETDKKGREILKALWG